MKFKLIKVKNIFAPTYKMDKQEGEKLRHQIKMEAINEMDKIINDTLNMSSKNIPERQSRRTTIGGNRDESSDSTSDRSGSLPPVSTNRQAVLKNKILRIKAKKNTKGLMNKLNVIRDNMYKQKLSQNSSNTSRCLSDNGTNQSLKCTPKKILNLAKLRCDKGILSRKANFSEKQSYTPDIDPRVSSMQFK